jgi:tetratricopeptide (TPR) repeat protein
MISHILSVCLFSLFFVIGFSGRAQQTDDSVSKAEFLYRSGMDYYNQKKFDDAIRDLYAATQINPKTSYVYALASAFYCKKNFRTARDLYQVVKSQRASYSDAYYMIGQCYLSEEDTTSAMEYFDSCWLLDKKHDRNLYGLALIYLAKKDTVAAKHCITQAIDSNPKESYYVLRALTEIGLLQEINAITDCEKAIAIEPKDEVAYCYRGLAYMALEFYQRAIKDFDKALGLYPNYLLAEKAKEHCLLYVK